MPKLRNQPPLKERKEQFLIEYSKNLGILSPTLISCRTTYNTYKKWFDEDSNFRESCMDVERSQGDFVENKLLEQITNGNITGIIFYLKCKRRDRWNDRTNQMELTGTIEHKQLSINVMDIETKQIMENVIEIIDKKNDMKN